MGQARSHISIAFTASHPDLADLHVHTEKFIGLAHKGHTHQVYDRAWVVFNKHLDLYHKDLEEIQEVVMIEFIAFPSLGQLAASTISLYVSGV